VIYLYGGQEKLRGEGGGLISFFLNRLFLKGVFEAMFKVKVNLGFDKYADGGPIMDVRVR
jgi:hypothetical protein